MLLFAGALLFAGVAALSCAVWWRSLNSYEAVQVRLSPGSYGPGLDVSWSRGGVDVLAGMNRVGRVYIDARRFALPGEMPAGEKFHLSASGGEARLVFPLWLPVALAAGGAGWLLWRWLRGRHNRR
jgi:hypothetical protein